MSLQLPTADDDEAATVCAAILTPVGAAIACDIVTVDDFYSLMFRRLFVAATRPDLATARGLYRVECVARAAGMTEDEVEQVLVRAMTWDNPRHWARRVVAAAQRRRLMAALADAYNLIGEGAPVEDALALVQAA